MGKNLKLVSLFPMPDISCERWSRKRIAKTILLLGVPLIVGEIGAIAQQYFDTIMVGHYNTNALAASSFVNSIFYFVFFLALGMSYASTPLIGNAFARKDNKSVIRIFKESLVVNLIVGLFFVAVLTMLYSNIEELFFTPQLLPGNHVQPIEILELSKGYMRLLIWSIPFLTLFFACKQYLDGIGNTRISMWIMLLANLVNIFLNWCLISGHCKFKAYGLYGAGIATLVSRIIQFALISLAVYKSNHEIFKYKVADSMPTINGVKQQFKLGFPVSIQLGLEIGVFNVCGIFMGWLGKLPLAAHQVMYTISTLFFQVLYGIGSAGTILISQFYGVKAWDNIRRTAGVIFPMGLIFVFPLSAMVWLLFEPFASFFTGDADVIKIMWSILPSLIIYQLGDCLQISYANALRGLEDTKHLAIVAFISYVFVCIPLCYLFAFQLDWPLHGVKGVWAGIPVGLTLAGFSFWLRFRTKLRCLRNE